MCRHPRKVTDPEISELQTSGLKFGNAGDFLEMFVEDVK